jgi:hypothetical protein
MSRAEPPPAAPASSSQPHDASRPSAADMAKQPFERQTRTVVAARAVFCTKTSMRGGRTTAVVAASVAANVGVTLKLAAEVAQVYLADFVDSLGVLPSLLREKVFGAASVATMCRDPSATESEAAAVRGIRAYIERSGSRLGGTSLRQRHGGSQLSLAAETETLRRVIGAQMHALDLDAILRQCGDVFTRGAAPSEPRLRDVFDRYARHTFRRSLAQLSTTNLEFAGDWWTEAIRNYVTLVQTTLEKRVLAALLRVVKACGVSRAAFVDTLCRYVDRRRRGNVLMLPRVLQQFEALLPPLLDCYDDADALRGALTGAVTRAAAAASAATTVRGRGDDDGDGVDDESGSESGDDADADAVQHGDDGLSDGDDSGGDGDALPSSKTAGLGFRLVLFTRLLIAVNTFRVPSSPRGGGSDGVFPTSPTQLLPRVNDERHCIVAGGPSVFAILQRSKALHARRDDGSTLPASAFCLRDFCRIRGVGDVDAIGSGDLATDVAAMMRVVTRATVNGVDEIKKGLPVACLLSDAQLVATARGGWKVRAELLINGSLNLVVPIEREKSVVVVSAWNRDTRAWRPLAASKEVRPVKAGGNAIGAGFADVPTKIHGIGAGQDAGCPFFGVVDAGFFAEDVLPGASLVQHACDRWPELATVRGDVAASLSGRVSVHDHAAATLVPAGAAADPGRTSMLSTECCVFVPASALSHGEARGPLSKGGVFDPLAVAASRGDLRGGRHSTRHRNVPCTIVANDTALADGS